MSPPAAVAAATLAASRTPGSGELRSSTGATYPLSGLTYLGSGGGRGVLALELASGRLMLSGRDGDQLSPTRWRLKIDRLRLMSDRPATGVCDLQLTANARSYAALSCRGAIAPDGEPFEVTWRRTQP